MSRPETGEIIDGKYRVEALLGEGGMGYVVHATHLLREAPVALKFLLPEVAELPGLAKRFTNEAVAASALECENVIRVHDVGERDGVPYLVMEYLQGIDLESACHGTTLDPPRAVHILLQVLLGLSAAHRKGIVHRDLKPANVFLLEHEGEEDFVKLLDFGVSKLDRPVDFRLTATGSGLGTPMYMSPEQARNAKKVDARTDLYAAGAMLYQMLSGRPPFEGGSMQELLAKVLLDAEPRLETVAHDLPEGLADIVHKALEKEPAKRFQDADEFLRAILPYADERSAVIVAKVKLKDSPRKSEVHLRAKLESVPLIEVPPAPAQPVSDASPVKAIETAATQQAFSAATQDSAQARAAEPKRKYSLLIGVGVTVFVLTTIGVLFALRPSDAPTPAASAGSSSVAPPASPASSPGGEPSAGAAPATAAPGSSSAAPAASAPPAARDSSPANPPGAPPRPRGSHPGLPPRGGSP